MALQFRNPAGQRRLGDVQRVCGTGEAAGINHGEKLAKLDGLRHGIDPALIGEAIDRLSKNESRARDELSRMNREPDEQSLLRGARPR